MGTIRKAQEPTIQGGALPDDELQNNNAQGGALPDEPVEGTKEIQVHIDFADNEDLLDQLRKYIKKLDELVERTEAATIKAEEAAEAAEAVVVKAIGTVSAGDTLVVTTSETLSNSAMANAMMRTRSMAKKIGVRLIILPRGVEVANGNINKQ